MYCINSLAYMDVNSVTSKKSIKVALNDFTRKINDFYNFTKIA